MSAKTIPYTVVQADAQVTAPPPEHATKKLKWIVAGGLGFTMLGIAVVLLILLTPTARSGGEPGGRNDDDSTPKPSHAPTFAPSFAPSTWAPTFQPTEIEILEEAVATMEELLPETAVAVIQDTVPEGEQRLSAYLAASVTLDAIVSLLPSSESENYTEHDIESLNADARDSLMRATECALYSAGGNATIAGENMAAAILASFVTDEYIRAFNNFSTGGSYITQVSSNANSTWWDSCESLLIVGDGDVSVRSPLPPINTKARLRKGHGYDTLASCGEDGDAAEEGARKIVDVFYVNGILTDGPSGMLSAVALTEMTKSVIGYPDIFISSVKSVHNPTEGPITDLLEVANLLHVELGLARLELTLEEVTRFYYSSKASGVSFIDPAFFDLPEDAGDAMYEKLQERWVGRVTAIGENSVSADKIVPLVQNSIANGHSVIIISHSQGNLYSNIAYNTGLSAEERPFVQLLSIATPSSYVGTVGVESPYVTRSDDLVIGAVGTSLPGNINQYQRSCVYFCFFSECDICPGSFVSSLASYSNHALIYNYLEDSLVSAEIRSKFSGLLSTSTFPDAIAGSGVLSVSLTWGDNADVDLHVYEPTGFHVYYGNKQGDIGYLDVDNTSGRGPENYFVQCAGLIETGTYKVGVVYYSGSAVQTATILVSYGVSVRSYSQVLLSSDSGFVYDIASITVTQNPEDGTYAYEVTSLQ